MASVLPQALNLIFQFLDSFAFLVLSAIGLAIIFGMMGVINLAHGEFITVGAYGTALSFNAGIPLPLSMLFGVVLTTAFGVIVALTAARRLYRRLLDSMVSTWGISLIMIPRLRVVLG